MLKFKKPCSKPCISSSVKILLPILYLTKNVEEIPWALKLSSSAMMSRVIQVTSYLLPPSSPQCIW